jgi:uncharacterized RDD family membrane protein YckC
VTAIHCPRCRREAPRPAPFCAGCGAPLLLGAEATPAPPLLLGDEAAPAPLDTLVDLDRRGRGRSGAEPAGVPVSPTPTLAAPGAEALAAFERSSWDLGRPPAAEATPLPGPRLPGVEADLAAPGAGGAPADPDALPDAEVDALEVHVERAPTWRRATAWALDAVPFAAGGIALGRTLLREARAGLGAPDGLDGLLDLVARERVIALSVAAAVALALAVYATLAHALAGATLGKRLLGLRVVGPDGGRPSPLRSAIRSALAVASAALLGLGFLLALFTRSGRALHDVIGRTWVVKAP